MIFDMRLVLATPVYPPELGEPAAYVKELARRLAEVGHDVQLVIFANQWEEVAHVSCVAVSKKQPVVWRFFSYTMALYRASAGAGCIFAYNTVAAGLPARLVGWLRRIPVIVWIREDEIWERASRLGYTHESRALFVDHAPPVFSLRILSVIHRFVLKQATRVVVSHEALRTHVVRAYGLRADRVHCEYPPAPSLQQLPFAAEPLPASVCMVADRLRVSDCLTCIRALSDLVKEIPECRLILAGELLPHEGVEIANELRSRGFIDRVSLLGRVSRAESWDLARNAGVWIVPSGYDMSPATIMEGWAAGAPVVATAHESSRACIVNDVSGMLVAEEDVADLSRACRRVLLDPAVRTTLITHGTQSVSTYTWEAHVASVTRLLSTYEST